MAGPGLGPTGNEFRVVWTCAVGHRNEGIVSPIVLQDGTVTDHVGLSFEDCRECGLGPELTEMGRAMDSLTAQVRARRRKMVDDFRVLSWPGHELSAAVEFWCYGCFVYVAEEEVGDHEGHGVSTVPERYCYVCMEMHSPEGH